MRIEGGLAVKAFFFFFNGRPRSSVGTTHNVVTQSERKRHKQQTGTLDVSFIYLPESLICLLKAAFLINPALP